MTGLQKFMMFVLPLERWKRAAEAESRAWMCRCNSCGFERSVWEAGGVRFKAYGNKLEYHSCPRCNKGRWFVLHHPQRAPLKQERGGRDQDRRERGYEELTVPAQLANIALVMLFLTGLTAGFIWLPILSLLWVLLAVTSRIDPEAC